MNQRNLEYIYPNNARSDFPIADNKLLTKQVLSQVGVSVPKTHVSYSSFFEMRNMAQDLAKYDEFVIKPAQGSGGGGILVMGSKHDGGWKTLGGTHYSLSEIKKHIADIVFGVYSFGLSDTAIIEAKVEQHEALNQLSPFGLTDVRMILCQHKPVLSMLRVPTKESDGKANLHQGALGVGIDIQTGQATYATHYGEAIEHHPDTEVSLQGFTLPFWDEIVRMSIKTAESVPLKYLGVDLVVSTDKPMVLEVNVRPGIEIQNANMIGMRKILKAQAIGVK
ncbi:MAG: sugar-transfer associated ATP-grasp domain-containing protein [Ghiorsea sp.]|nr:sugar-transfer associated ATP-grasp domain-containing protein [Ghiorsea sp.]